MQISAANLLQAGQQPKAAQQPANRAAFDTVLQGKKPETAVAVDGFADMVFKQTASTPQPAAPAASPAQPYGAAQRLGSQLDIRI